MTHTVVIIALLVVCALTFIYASVKAKANAQLTRIIEQLWEIIDDIDTYSDVCKVDDVAYRQLVENRQKDRWQTGITTDGHGLFIPTLDVRLNPHMPLDSGFGEAIAAEPGVADPSPAEDAVTKEYVASGVEGASHLLPTSVDTTVTLVSQRYMPITLSTDFVAMCSMLAVDPATIYFDSQEAVFVKKVGDEYNRLDFQFAHPNSVAEKIEDAEKLVASGENVEIAPKGLQQVTQKRFFGLVLETHYILCEPGEATHFCKLTENGYAYAKQSL